LIITRIVEETMPSVKDNIRIHDRGVKNYERVHREIFNEIEQRRLRDTLEFLVNTHFSEREKLDAIDFGSGTGNVTKHLQEIGFAVTSADVSLNSLEYVSARYGSATAFLDNGSTSDLKSEAYDFVVAYSVLHHIPDYMATLGELGRICRPGGIVYLDHEASPSFWRNQEEILKAQRTMSRFDIRKFLRLRNYVHKVVTIFSPRHAVEGDIHVWPDDHIEWDKIEIGMRKLGFEMVFVDDFLVYNSLYDLQSWSDLRDVFSDTRCSAFKKIS
jgi:SAM-dependent methyltransferase